MDKELINLKIGIANDHKGLKLKQEVTDFLEKEGYTIINYGTDTIDSVDYPVYAFKVGEAIQRKEIDMGILICGTGIGMSIAANKVKGIRCAKVDNLEEASLTRKHNNANVIAINCNNENAIEIIDTFLTTQFSNETRHQRRIELIHDYER